MSSDSKENVNLTGEETKVKAKNIIFVPIKSDDVPLEDDPDLSSTSLLHELIDQTPDSSFHRLSLDEKKKSREKALGLSFFSERSGKGLEISMEEGGSRQFEAQAIPVQSEAIRMRRRKRAASLRPYYGSFRMPLMSKLGMSEEEENLNRDSNPAGYVRQLLKYMDENPAAPSDRHPTYRRSSVLIHKSRLAKLKEAQDMGIDEEEKEEVVDEEEDEEDDDFQRDLYTPYTEEERTNLEKFMNEDKVSTFIPFGKLDYLSGEKGGARGSHQMPSTVVEKTRKPSYDDYYSGSYFNDQRILPSEGMEEDRTGLWDREISDPSHLAGTTSRGIDKVLPTPRKTGSISDSPEEGYTPVPSTLTSLDEFIRSGELEKLLPMDESKRPEEIDKVLPGQLHTLDSLEDLIKKEGALRGPREKMVSSISNLPKQRTSKTKAPKSAISVSESSKSVLSRKKKLTFEESKPVTVFYPEMETPPPEADPEPPSTESSPRDSE